jgi:hypothetical protein
MSAHHENSELVVTAPPEVTVLGLGRVAPGVEDALTFQRRATGYRAVVSCIVGPRQAVSAGGLTVLFAPGPDAELAIEPTRLGRIAADVYAALKFLWGEPDLPPERVWLVRSEAFAGAKYLDTDVVINQAYLHPRDESRAVQVLAHEFGHAYARGLYFVGHPNRVALSEAVARLASYVVLDYMSRADDAVAEIQGARALVASRRGPTEVGGLWIDRKYHAARLFLVLVNRWLSAPESVRRLLTRFREPLACPASTHGHDECFVQAMAAVGDLAVPVVEIREGSTLAVQSRCGTRVAISYLHGQGARREVNRVEVEPHAALKIGGGGIGEFYTATASSACRLPALLQGERETSAIQWRIGGLLGRLAHTAGNAGFNRVAVWAARLECALYGFVAEPHMRLANAYRALGRTSQANAQTLLAVRLPKWTPAEEWLEVMRANAGEIRGHADPPEPAQLQLTRASHPPGR